MVSSEQESEITGVSKSIVMPQKVAHTNLDAPEEQLKRSISLEQEGLTLIWLQVHTACYIAQQLPYYLVFWTVYFLATLFAGTEFAR